MMTKLLCIAALLLLPSAVCAQARMSCRREPIPASALRAGGTGELLPDIELTCTGGPSGSAAVPRYEILVSANTPLSVRQFLPPADPGPVDPLATTSNTNVLPWTEALLLVDDPRPSAQVPCAPDEGADTCSASADTMPNVFQGRQLLDNTVIFRHVPVASAASDGTRVLRIVNLRADTNLIPKKPVAGQVSTVVQIFDQDGNPIPIEDAQAASGDATPAFTMSLRASDDGPVPDLAPAVTATASMLPQSAANSPIRFNVKFTEGFASAFRRRNLGTSADDPNFIASQALPGSAPPVESGFYNAAFPSTNGMNLAGLADSGTRLRVVFQNIPANVLVYVTTREAAAGTTGYTSTEPKAILTDTDATGAGGFSPPISYDGGLVQLQVVNGTARAVWEVVSSDPTQLEDFSFTVVLGSQPDHSPALGLASVRGDIGPAAAQYSYDPKTIPEPFFVEQSSDATAIPAFKIAASVQTPELTNVSAASFGGTAVAPASIVAAFGSGLPTGTPSARTAVQVIDANGVKREQQVLLLSSSQVNYLLDASTATGLAIVNVTNSGHIFASGYLQVNRVAPALFSADGTGRGTALGEVVRIAPDSTDSTPLAVQDPDTGAWQASSIDLGGSDGVNLLNLYGTGIRGRSAVSKVTLTIGGEKVPVLAAGAQSGQQGVDVVTAGPLPFALRGRGDVTAVLTVDGVTANPLSIRFK